MSFSLDSTLAHKFEARVYSSLQVESLGLDYTLASNLGATQLIQLQPQFYISHDINIFQLCNNL